MEGRSLHVGGCRPVWTRGLLRPQLFAVGVHWDVVRVEADAGVRALRVLEDSGVPVGPALHDRGRRRIYFLTPPESAASWTRTGTRALGPGAWVVLVPPGWEDWPLRWLTGPVDVPAFTAAADLGRALAVAARQGSTSRTVETRS